MECENGDETVWTRQIWHSEIMKVFFLESSIVAFYLFSQPNTWEFISTMSQRWINNGSTMDQRCTVGTSITCTCNAWWLAARTRTTTPEEERQRQTLLFLVRLVFSHGWPCYSSFDMKFENVRPLVTIDCGVIWCELEHLFLEKSSM